VKSGSQPGFWICKTISVDLPQWLRCAVRTVSQSHSAHRPQWSVGGAAVHFTARPRDFVFRFQRRMLLD